MNETMHCANAISVAGTMQDKHLQVSRKVIKVCMACPYGYHTFNVNSLAFRIAYGFTVLTLLDYVDAVRDRLNQTGTTGLCSDQRVTTIVTSHECMYYQ
jgi:hypothetical protein